MGPEARDLTVCDDIVIVGGGLAGLFCAAKMAPRPVTLITPNPIGDAADAAVTRNALAPLTDGAPTETLAAETIAAGDGIADRSMVELMAREASAHFEDLATLGAGNDGTGGEIVAALAAKVRETPSIRTIEGYFLEDLVKDGSRVGGLIAIANDPDAGPAEIRLAARAVVLATGGIGALYAETANRAEASGQGLAAAAQAGALIADAEFVQFQGAAAQFHMGGVLTDANGRSSVDGLWACGEVASTGAHGAGMLPENALVEAIVFAARTAQDLCTIYPAAAAMPPPQAASDVGAPGLFQETAAIDRLRALMSANVGAQRDRNGLVAALKEIAALEREGGLTHGFRNTITTARLIAHAALMRPESRGTHRRSDFPDKDPAQARRNAYTLRTVEANVRQAIAEDLVYA